MLWSPARPRRPRNVVAQQRVAEVRRDHPEAEAWLELLEAALAESEEATWEAGVPAALADRPAKAPVLFRARLAVNARAAERWVRRIAGRQVDAGALLEAAVCQDDVRIEALAATAGAEPEALRVAAQMAAVPLLQACGRAFAPQLAPTWWEGYCPVCGAWPLLSELRGLERARRLRCGRCAADWRLAWLQCAYCGERRHERLGSLVSEGQVDGRKIEICTECRGYMKSVSTLEPLTPAGVLLTDLETVELDLVAREREWIRPDRPACALDVRIVGAPRAVAERSW